MRIVVALGGNALLKRGEPPDADRQERNVALAVDALAPLAMEHELVITHGNGPQVGILALQSASDPHLTTPYPFDVLGAQTQGMIGYWLLQSMQNALPDRQVAAVINQTLVAADDPAFGDPAKFVGEVYTRGAGAPDGGHPRLDRQARRRLLAARGRLPATEAGRRDPVDPAAAGQRRHRGLRRRGRSAGHPQPGRAPPRASRPWSTRT